VGKSLSVELASKRSPYAFRGGRGGKASLSQA